MSLPEYVDPLEPDFHPLKRPEQLFYEDVARVSWRFVRITGFKQLKPAIVGRETGLWHT